MNDPSQSSSRSNSKPIQIQSLKPTGVVPLMASDPLAAIPVAYPRSTPAVQASAASSSAAMPSPTGPIHAAIPPPSRISPFVRYWRKVGGGSLMLSLLVHGLVIIAAFFIVETITRDEKVDFLPGGGSKNGTEANEQRAEQVRVKKQNKLQKSIPVQRLVSLNTTSAIYLPETPPDDVALPEMSSAFGGGSMSSGFGASGSGGGFGSGNGFGGMKGNMIKPLMMFGRDQKVRSIAVVMDVSGSMTKHLAYVVKELDRVAKGSPVVLYVGCGVMPIPPKTHIDDNGIEVIRSLKTKDPAKNFEIFWRRSHGQGEYQPPKNGEAETIPIPELEVYEIFAKRPQTYFIKMQGIQYAWTALVCSEVRQAEAVYWFSDFQDATEEKQLKRVSDTLRRRHQKLFMHASEHGNSYDKVLEELVKPTGGEARR